MPLARRHCLSLMVALLASQAWGVEPAVLRVVGSADAPFRIFPPGEPATGLYYDLMREAARRLAWPVSFTELPAARAFKMMELGEADLMLGPLRLPEREAYLVYTRVTLPIENKAFYTRPEATPVRELEDLLGRGIAVQRGKRYGAAFDNEPRLQRHELNDYRTALEMVQRGRLDVAVLPERQGDMLLRELGLGLRKQPWRLPGEQPYLVLARRSPWLARQAELERVFQAMRDDGSWRRIEARY